MSSNKKIAIIIGAGPAGLTAAYELLEKTDIKPVILESTSDIGGISKTVNYKGNRIDIGGHRFFSKSDLIMDWWLKILPVQQHEGQPGPNPDKEDNVMLVRSRLSRIYFLRKFFDYPVSLNWNTIKNLGLIRIIKIGFSYLWIRLFPVKNEKSLEDFFINRFGKQLYKTFFKNYTEKVWGVKCSEISAEWGAQRVKGLSVSKAFVYAIKRVFSSNTSIRQKNIETSLIEKFLYPKYGPGHLWQRVADLIQSKGGIILFNHNVTGLYKKNNIITGVKAIHNGKEIYFNADFVFSSMPVKDLLTSMNDVPEEIKSIASGLMYRDFITVGLLLKKLKIENKQTIKDNWIYIQESDVKVGRLQIFNNWSPYMVADKNNIWIGLEYFCNENDDMWNMDESSFKTMACDELEKIGMIDKDDVIDSVLIKMPKTYPAYFGSYSEFDKIIDYTNGIENLFLIGRNGMHKYNNQDHSMLTAITAVENIISHRKDKSNIWSVNTEQDYHEEK
ncbi:MAG: NAD(P)/FAD-dependent oxidoreductase [Marinilabiliales bacterium]